jgi:hypothetical protein
MSMSPETSWDAALEQLTALPGDLQEEHGAANFMRAGKFRRNGRALFEQAIEPLLKDGRKFEVVLGFVDSAVAEAAGLSREHGYTIGSSEFLAARLRDADSGEIVDVAVCPAIAN